MKLIQYTYKIPVIYVILWGIIPICGIFVKTWNFLFCFEEGTGGVSPPVGGDSGGLPRENFEKMMQNGAIWGAIKTHLNLAVSLVKLH